MSHIAIKVENLSKKYIIRHEKKSARYETFSDSLVQGSKKIANKIIHPFSGNKIDPQTQEEFWALKDINFEINQGDKVGIIGRNGAGKSTLLKVLSRITEPTTGKIHINGRIASLLEVGTGFHPELTGRENIYLNGAILGMNRKEIKAKFDEIVDFAEVEKFLDTPVKRYSSGMYVRLAFSVAAHLEPDILVVDEVLAVGDSGFQKKCLGKMDSISNLGRTIIFVSHNMTALKKLCNKSIYLEKGNVIDFSETLAIIHKYQRSFSKTKVNNFEAVASLLESSFILIDFQLLNVRNEKTTIFESGSIINFKLNFRSKSIYSKLQISIGLDSLEGERVGYLNNSMTETALALSAGDDSIVCTIPKLALVPGDYYISLKVIRNFETCFWLATCLKFTVVDGDFFGTGKLIQERWVGKNYIEHFWK